MNLTTLLSSYQTIDCPDEFLLEYVTSNENFFLIGKDSEFILFDKPLTMVEKMSWKNPDIHDMY